MRASCFTLRLLGLSALVAGCGSASDGGDEHRKCEVFQHVDELFLHGDFLQARGNFSNEEQTFRVVRLKPDGSDETTIEQADWQERVGNVDLGPRHFGRATREALEVFEVNDAGEPSPLGVTDFVHTSGLPYASTWGAHDSVLYRYGGTWDGACGIWKIDLTDPAVPGEQAQVANRACDEGVDLVQGFGGSLFLEMSPNELFIVDLITGEEIFNAPWQGGSAELKGQVASDGNVAVFAPRSRDHALVVYPRADPPRVVDAPFGGLGSILLAVRNGVAYVSVSREGQEYLESWDLSNPDSITPGATQVLLQEPEGTIGGRETTVWGISDDYIVVSGPGPGMGSIYVVPRGMRGKLGPFAISAPPEECDGE